MYVCVCKAVTDRQLRAAVADGATSMRKLRQTLGVCSDCGTCGPYARELLREAVAATAAPMPAVMTVNAFAV